MINLFNVPISITSKSQALAEVEGWVRKYRSANPSEHSENSDSRKVRQSEDQKSRLNLSDSLIFRDSDSSGSPSIPSFPKIVVTPNPEIIVAAQSDPEFLKALQSADLAIPDGVGIVVALRLLGTRDKGQGTRENSDSLSAFSPQPLAFSPGLFARLSGLDLMESLIGESVKNGWKVMLLGGKPGIAGKAAKKLMHQIRPGLAKQGRAFIKSISGPQNISKSANDRLISQINSFSPDLLFVAFGHGRQEKWLAANRRRLNVGVAMGVGGAFDQIADPSLRPPSYINSIGLGWLYRLFRQPWRWRRQLSLIKFIGIVLLKKFLNSEHSEYSESRDTR